MNNEKEKIRSLEDAEFAQKIIRLSAKFSTRPGMNMSSPGGANVYHVNILLNSDKKSHLNRSTPSFFPDKSIFRLSLPSYPPKLH